jgi:tripartite-type tricarboxylate transporter receptor subunit TctC
MTRLKELCSVFVLAVCASAGALADTYPSRPITMVVAFPPGGASDVIGRAVAQKLSERLGQQVVVDNRAGAGGNMGAKQASLAKNDGYTLLMGAITAHSIAQTLTPDTANYRLDKDFAPVSMLGSVPLYLVVNPTLPVKNLQEFIALARQKPGQLTVSSAGIGTTQHLAAELFMIMTNTQMLHVPYKGSGPAVADLLAGHVQFSFSTPPAVMGYIKSGQLKAIGLAADEPSPLAPGVPTFAQQGLPGVSLATWYGLFGPSNMDPALVQKISSTITTAARSDAFKARMAQGGLDPILSSPAQFTAYLAAERARWTQVAKDIGFKHE